MTKQIREARDEGFTLIELLIVIVVLGILAGIVVFGVATFRGDANTAACKADLKTVQVASDAYFAKVGSYASAIGATGSTNTTQLTGAGYLKQAPLPADNITYSASTGVASSSNGGCTN